MATEHKAATEAKPNRKQRREQQRKIWTDNPGLDVLHPNAAGIDVGNSEHYVAIAPDNSGAEVYKGIYRFAYFGRSLKADPAAINAQKAQCSKAVPS